MLGFVLWADFVSRSSELSITALLNPLGVREQSVWLAEYEELPVGLGQGYLIRVCGVNENIHTRIHTCNHFASWQGENMQTP